MAPAKPILKWAGGKTQLLAQFAGLYPPELASGDITRYVEPFVGGGAVFLDIAQRFKINEAILLDVNEELILVYTVVQRDPTGLIQILTDHNEKYYSLDEAGRHDYFYAIRTAYNKQRPQIDHSGYSEEWIVRAAYMIFLNKTCFNGLFRVNRQGGFNVPFGRYKRPAILDAENIRNVSSLLKNTKLQTCHFSESKRYVHDKTFVYFDPPYRPISPTASFTSYSKTKFDDEDQIQLACFFSCLNKDTTAKLMLSNSDPANIDAEDDFFGVNYPGFKIRRVQANRMINRRADRRGKITEVVITNYPTTRLPDKADAPTPAEMGSLPASNLGVHSR
ncbi:MAG: DNA adenine methylase [Caldilineaceae bacterium]|nr:DNA adenine methylase [Caldilineaceae bacterium]